MLKAAFILLFGLNTSSYGLILSNSVDISRSSHSYRKKALLTRVVVLGVKDNDEDDGWGTSSKLVGKLDELEALKSDRESKRSDSSTSIQNRTNADQERDLFIPIFAIISLAGLFGAYGYEMLRLNANGELYLPWRQ